MREIVLFLFLSGASISSNLLAQESNQLIGKSFSVGESPIDIGFSEKTMKISNWESDESDELPVTYKIVDGQIFVTIQKKPIHVRYFEINSVPTTWLVVTSEDGLLALYNREYSKPLTGDVVAPNKGFDFGVGHTYYPSSVLVEGTTKYSADNVEKRVIGLPWVSSAKNSGINDTLKIVAHEKNTELSTLASGYRMVISDFWILGGFVSYSRPSLYRQNARPKVIEVETQAGTQTFTLQDTPSFQHIRLNSRSEWIKIRIVGSFPGSKYADCPISGIITRTWIVEK